MEDIDTKLAEFAALKTKALKTAYLKKINEGIPNFKNQIRVTGNIDVITANYRTYLERVAATAGNTNTKASVSSSSRGQRKKPAVAANLSASKDDEDEYDDEADEVDDHQDEMAVADKSEGKGKGKVKGKKVRDVSSSTSSKSKGKRRGSDLSTQQEEGEDGEDGEDEAPATGLLSQLMHAPGCELSAVTRECLEVLGSTLATTQAAPDEDYSITLRPLFEPLFELICRRNTIQRSANYAENFEKLRIEAVRINPVDAEPVLNSLITAMGLKRSGNDLDDLDDPEVEVPSGLAKDISVLWNEFDLSLHRWSQSFPAPPAGQEDFPADFSDVENQALRKYANDFINANLHLAEKHAKPKEIQDALQELMRDWPIAKGRGVKSIAKLVFDEAKLKYNRRTGSRSRSRSTTETSRRGSMSEGQLEEEEVGGDVAEDGQGEDQGRPSRSKGKRPRAVDSDEEDDGASSMSSKSMRTERGRGRGRGRTRGHRYESPSKKGETSLASIEETDEEGDD